MKDREEKRDMEMLQEKVSELDHREEKRDIEMLQEQVSELGHGMHEHHRMLEDLVGKAVLGQGVSVALLLLQFASFAICISTSMGNL